MDNEAVLESVIRREIARQTENGVTTIWSAQDDSNFIDIQGDLDVKALVRTIADEFF